MKKLYFLLILFACLLSGHMRAQDANFSQFFFKEAYYNPAFTGINPGLRGVLTNRQFWTSVPGTHSSTHAMVEYYDKKFFSGAFGLNLLSTTKGNFLNSNQIGLQYAKRLTLASNFVIQAGFQGAFVHKTLNFDELKFPDQFDPRLGEIYQSEFVSPGDEPVMYFDYSAGVVARFNIMQTSTKVLASNNIGIAAHHLSQPDEGFYKTNKARLPLKVNIHWYSIIKVNRNAFYNSHFLLAPGIMYETQKLGSSFFKRGVASSNTLSFGVNGIIPSRLSFMSQLYTGVWLRKQFAKTVTMTDVKKMKGNEFDAVVLMLGFIKYTRDGKRNIRFAYSYDLTVSNAGVRTGGSHEVTIAFEIHNLALPGRGRSWDFVKNPNDRFYNFSTGR